MSAHHPCHPRYLITTLLVGSLLGVASTAPPVGAQSPSGKPAIDGDTGLENHLRIEPQRNLVGKKITITAGEIPLRDFVRFLSNFTGLPILVDSSDSAFTSREIEVVAPLHNVNGEVVKALLETNRIRLYNEKLPDGTEILKVENPKGSDPKPIVVVQINELEKIQSDIDPDQYATMVFDLEHAEPRTAIETLRKLVNEGSSPAKAGAARSGGDSSFNMVEVEDMKKIIITAKFGLLSYLRQLLLLIDVPIKEPDQILRTYQIEWANAREIADLIGNLVHGPGRDGLYGASGNRPLNSPRPSAMSATARSVKHSGKADHSTKLYPDDRTNKILVETYFKPDLETIDGLLAEFDVPPNNRRLTTHIYHVRYLKAVDIAEALDRLLLQDARRTGSSSRGSSRSRGRSTGSPARRGIPRRGASAAVSGSGDGAPDNQYIPSRIVPYLQTNTLLIQAEPEEYREILNILGQIDTKRRQVFLEAAVVQVRSDSNLNHSIELLAGNPHPESSRVLAASSFGLGLDFDTFDRAVPESGNVPGALLALMKNGKFPAIVQFFKKNADAQVLATPFILADDNEPNSIQIIETRFSAHTQFSDNDIAVQQQIPTDAGIILEITPTVSGSQKAVFLTLELSVSEFLGDPTETSLQPTSESRISGAVTVPDGEVFVIGGLTREKQSKVVEKVPVLGDIPVLGMLFSKEGNEHLNRNLYVFLRAQILSDENFADGKGITGKARKDMERFDASIPFRFKAPGQEASSAERNRKKLRGWFE